MAKALYTIDRVNALCSVLGLPKVHNNGVRVGFIDSVSTDYHSILTRLEREEGVLKAISIEVPTLQDYVYGAGTLHSPPRRGPDGYVGARLARLERQIFGEQSQDEIRGYCEGAVEVDKLLGAFSFWLGEMG